MLTSSLCGVLVAGLPSTSFAAYYLSPPNVHLVAGATVQLNVIDDDGNVVTDSTTFFGYNSSLISVSASGVVTALRTENATEIGTWVSATVNGMPANSKAIVRVLSKRYNLPYQREVGTNSVLYYPTTLLRGEDLSTPVSQYELSKVSDDLVTAQSLLMGERPFNGAKQIIAVDLGESESQRVCGLSGNPVRLGWNISGMLSNNCFLWDPSYKHPWAPRWSVIAHEIGHNFTMQSRTFAVGLAPPTAPPSYREGLATVLGRASLNAAICPLRQNTRRSIADDLDMTDSNFDRAYRQWLAAGANFGDISADPGNGPDIVAGLYAAYRSQRPHDFDGRFFKPLRPAFVNQLSAIIENLRPGDAHTVFAALLSAALGRDLSSEFIATYHYPLNTGLFASAYTAFRKIVALPQITDGDFDGDGKTEIALYRPATGVWYILKSSTNFTCYDAYPFGVSTDVPVSGDYDGDGKNDIAVYRPATGVWYILESSTGLTRYLPFGLSTDRPVPDDYDGDGKTDVAVYRPSTGVWYVLKSSTDFSRSDEYRCGGVSTDIPRPADYDGDGKADVALYRPATSGWYILNATTNLSCDSPAYAFGVSTDVPVSGDYDGDGKTDVAVYRPSTGVWYVLKSSTGFRRYAAYAFGLSTIAPCPMTTTATAKSTWRSTVFHWRLVHPEVQHQFQQL